MENNLYNKLKELKSKKVTPGVTHVLYEFRNELYNAEKYKQILIDTLRKETDWVSLVGSQDDHNSDVRAILSSEEGSAENIILMLQKQINQLINTTQEIVRLDGLWEYCETDVIEQIINLQQDKLNHLEVTLNDYNVIILNNSPIRSLKFKDLSFEKLSDTEWAEENPTTAKYKLAVLYKLGVIDFLKNNSTLKNNNSELGRVISLFAGGSPNAYITTLSAENARGIRPDYRPRNMIKDNDFEKAKSDLERCGFQQSVNNYP